MTLQALLEELKLVDPAIYEEIQLSREPLEEISWCDLDNDAIVSVTRTQSCGWIVEESNQYLDIIQGCIQRAITGREGWEVSFWWKDGYWAALIRLPGGYTDMTKVFAEEGNSAAEALLTAYVAAVKRQA